MFATGPFLSTNGLVLQQGIVRFSYQNFQQIVAFQSTDCRAVSFNPDNSAVVVGCTDGKIYRSTDSTFSSFSVIGNASNGVGTFAWTSNTTFFLGGVFQTIQNKTMNYISYWNGTNFNSLGTGCNGQVFSMAFSTKNQTLYVGGGPDFTICSSVFSPRLIKYEILSNDFVPFTLSMDSAFRISALAYDSVNDFVYVGGNFAFPALNFFRWIPSTSSQVAILFGGVGSESSEVSSIAIDNNGGIYIGGGFLQAGGVSVGNIARISLNGTVNALDSGVSNFC